MGDLEGPLAGAHPAKALLEEQSVRGAVLDKEDLQGGGEHASFIGP